MISCYSYYITATCKAYFDDNKEPTSLEKDINNLKAISFTALTVILIISSFIMIRRLKHRFHGLYTDYGKILWIIIIS